MPRTERAESPRFLAPMNRHRPEHKGLELHIFESGLAHEDCQCCGGFKGLRGFRQILIGTWVAANKASQQWNYIFKLNENEGSKQILGWRRTIQNHDATTRLEDAQLLSQRAWD